jgi:hypothetical protein
LRKGDDVTDDQFGEIVTESDWPMPAVSTITAFGHGLSAGDVVHVYPRSRWREFFRRPRARVVTHADCHSFTYEERRITWAEWRGELRDILRDWARRLKVWAVGWSDDE